LLGETFRERQVLLPYRVNPVHGDHDPNAVVRRLGGITQTEPHIGGTPVLLAGIARSASRNHVVPGMCPSPALGDDVIDVLGGASAVLAFVVIAYEHGPTRQRCPGAVGNLDEVVEPDDTRGPHLQMLGSEHVTVRVDDFSFAFQGKDQCPPDRNNAQRLVRGVEDQRSPQSQMSISRGVPGSSL
jgi:hypothetical protein